MLQLFIYIFVGLALLTFAMFYIFKALYVDEGQQELNFGTGEVKDFEEGYIAPAPRESAAYQEQQSGVIAIAIKKAPKTIMTTILIQLFLMLFTGYLSVKNIERLAMAGSALVQGDYGMAISALWPIGKEAGVEQYRVARGTNPYLDENGLHNFIYIGQYEGKSYAVMGGLYSTQDHDLTLSKDNESYGTIILGLSAEKANKICGEKYKDHNGQLLSPNIWSLIMGHFLSARNIDEHPNIPEWTSEIHKDDSDDFLVLSKETGITKWAENNNIDREENGLYIDSEDLKTAGFRCEISW